MRLKWYQKRGVSNAYENIEPGAGACRRTGPKSESPDPAFLGALDRAVVGHSRESATRWSGNLSYKQLAALTRGGVRFPRSPPLYHRAYVVALKFSCAGAEIMASKKRCSFGCGCCAGNSRTNLQLIKTTL